MEFNAIILSFVVSTLVVMTGVGGGSLMAPILIFGAGISPAVAVGTDLIYAAITKTGALVIHARDSRVRWTLAGWMLAGSVPASLAATAMMWHLGRGKLDGVISVALAVALMVSALAILLRDRVNARRLRAGTSPSASPHYLLLLAVGALVGALVTLSSVGAGSIGIAALMLLIPSLDARAAVGTDLAYGAVLAAVAAMGHVLVGSVDLALLANLLIGMVPGIYFGGRLVGLLPERVLRPVISVALFGAALKLI